MGGIYHVYMLVPKFKFGILTDTNSGIPEPIWGLPFWCFFSVTHKIGLFLSKIEVIPNAMAHLLITKKISNQHTAPAY
jgi:hypothetical protein